MLLTASPPMLEDGVRFARVVCVMTESVAGRATFVESLVQRPDPEGTDVILVQIENRILGQAGRIVRIMAEVLERGTAAAQAIEAAAHGRNPEAAVAGTGDELDEIVGQANPAAPDRA